jgi:hypothetical protein
MSETADRVKKIVVEHLGVDADKVTEDSSFIDDLRKNLAWKFPTMPPRRSRPSRTRSHSSMRTRAKPFSRFAQGLNRLGPLRVGPVFRSRCLLRGLGCVVSS